jgi:hypothetical protein
MAKSVVSRKPVVIAANSGAELRVDAEFSEPASGGGGNPAAAIVFAATLLVLSFFFPPILLLNIPLLVLRSAWSEMRTARQEAVALPAFACPLCAAENPEQRRPGSVPFVFTCGRCGEPLEVRRPPRTNLALSSP